MADFNPKNYEAFSKEEANAVENLKMRVGAIQEGSRVLFYNSAARRDEWRTVARIEKYDACTARITATDGKQFWASEIRVISGDKQAETLLICLNDRKREFIDALNRANAGRLEVFPDFERDHFVVTNHENGNVYDVTLKTVDGKVLASCQQHNDEHEPCADFRYRSRVCKHISVTLQDVFFDVLQTAEVFDQAEAVVFEVARI